LGNLLWRPRVALPVAALMAILVIGSAVVTLTSAQEPPPVPVTAQSPIDIETEELAEDDLPKLRFDYPRKITLEVVNTGSPDEFATVKANVDPGESKLQVGGNWYHLLQFHWHTPGEHELDGQGFPMEMHLVHQRVGASGSEGLLVVGVWMEVDQRHSELDKIFDDLPEAGQAVLVKDFKLRRLLPEDRESFRYQGSLTTPPFTEGVQWVVLEQPLEVSEEQVEALMVLFPQGNSREVQPLNDRLVLTDSDQD
jgi:carbonic anhydrase